MKVSLFFHIWYFLIAVSPNFTVIFNITHLFATDQQTGASKCFFLCKTLVLTAHLFLFFFLSCFLSTNVTAHLRSGSRSVASVSEYQRHTCLALK